MKVYCARCSLYLGQLGVGEPSSDKSLLQVICPICEETTARIRYMLSGDYTENLEFPNHTYISWLGWVMSRQHEDEGTINLVRLMTEGRDRDFFVFPEAQKEIAI